LSFVFSLISASAQPTAWLDIRVDITTNTAIYFPIKFTIPYLTQLVDPSSGVIYQLYPNRVLNISTQEYVTAGSYSIDSQNNRISFWIGHNLTSPGNYTFYYRVIYNVVLMQNATVDIVFKVLDPNKVRIYRVPITVTNNLASALSNYQVLLYLNLSSQVSAGKIRSDLGDIRFKDSSGNDLSYWIENNTASAARIWVKVPSIPASGSTTIYMYYRNSSATTTSNGTATFIFFDDFEAYTAGQALPTTKWAYQTAGWKIYQDTIGKVVRYEGGSSVSEARAINNVNVTGGFAVEGLVKSESGKDAGLMICATSDTSTTYGYDYYIGWGWNSGTHAVIYYFEGSSYTILASTSNAVPTTYTRTTVTHTSSGLMKLIRDGRVLVSATHTTYTGGFVGIVTWYDSYPSSYWDWIAVRNYVDPEPTVSIGSEEEELLTNYGATITYGQLSTETQMQVKVPQIVPQQVLFVNISTSYTNPMSLPDAIKIIYSFGYVGRVALSLIPVLLMLLAGRHYAGIMGGICVGIMALINYTLGVELFDWMVIGVIAFICVLIIVMERG
jgi:hypothetical protein